MSGIDELDEVCKRLVWVLSDDRPAYVLPGDVREDAAVALWRAGSAHGKAVAYGEGGLEVQVPEARPAGLVIPDELTPEQPEQPEHGRGVGRDAVRVVKRGPSASEPFCGCLKDLSFICRQHAPKVPS